MASNSLTLESVDSELFALIKKEKLRQREGIELIASENFTSRAVMECLGSCLTNKYSEGYPGARYYGGNEIIDHIETLCQKRALKAFDLDQSVWGCNVQPYSGSPANFAVYTGLLAPHDRIMGLDLPSGGHLTHGFYTAKKRISATSIYFESLPYNVDISTGYIDYDQLEKQARIFRPKLIIAGISAYPRQLDYKRFRSICDEVGALLMADMAHVAGLVAGKVQNSPFEYCDVVTTTTHKTLRGPRAGVIFYNKARHPDIEANINGAVFPGLQGGPHDNQVAAIAAQFAEVSSPGWSEYAQQVVKNAKHLAQCLMDKGNKLVTDGTENHIVLWDLRKNDLTGSKFEKVSEAVGISLNKNCVPGDVSALSPSGVRLGTPAMTTRGLKEKDFEKVAEFLCRILEICVEIQKSHGKKIIDFTNGISGNSKIEQLKKDIVAFATQFPLPGQPEL